MKPRRSNTVCMVIALLVALAGLPAFDVWSMGSRVPTVGMQAEDFQLSDLDGKTQSLSQYRGKIVLVNFWATWCKPCTTEMPAMQTTYDKLRTKGSSFSPSTSWKTTPKCASTSSSTVTHSQSSWIATIKWPTNSAYSDYP